MNKKKFELYVLKNIEDITSFHCNIVESFDMDGNSCCWLDVYISGEGFAPIYCSDNYPVDSKEVVKLQKQWLKKLKSWIYPNWGIPLEVIRYGV